MKLSQVAYIHVFQILEFFQIYLETLNFRSKFGNVHSNWPFSQTTHCKWMKLSQIAYIHVFELSGLFQFFSRNFEILVKIWKCTFKLIVLSNDSFKMNQTFPDCLNTCIWISGIFSNFSGNKIWKCTFKSTVLSNDSLKMNETFPDCLHTCIWITGFFQIFLETLNFWLKIGSVHSNQPSSQTSHWKWMKLS
jgi:hypothetical protein